MANRFKIYSLKKRFVQAPDEAYHNTWQLDNNGIAFKIRSIFWDFCARTYEAADPTRGEWLVENSNALKFQLFFGEGTPLIHSVFNEATMTDPMDFTQDDYNGKRMYFWKPGQYVFNSWDVYNSITMRVDVSSCDRVNSFLSAYQVSVEIEEFYQ